jgi:hypothetical protein
MAMQRECKTIGAGIGNYREEDKPQVSGGNKRAMSKDMRAIFIVQLGRVEATDLLRLPPQANSPKNLRCNIKM